MGNDKATGRGNVNRRLYMMPLKASAYVESKPSTAYQIPNSYKQYTLMEAMEPELEQLFQDPDMKAYIALVNGPFNK
jgi:hypothetical protein